jgi:hypothetical protein
MKHPFGPKERISEAVVKMNPAYAEQIQGDAWPETIEHYGVLNLQKPKLANSEEDLKVIENADQGGEPWLAFAYRDCFGDATPFVFNNKDLMFLHHMAWQMMYDRGGAFDDHCLISTQLQPDPLTSQIKSLYPTFLKEFARVLPILISDDCVCELARKMTVLRKYGREKEQIARNFENEDADLVGAALTMAFGEQT